MMKARAAEAADVMVTLTYDEHSYYRSVESNLLA